ncbi:glycosyltransferase family 4 protein [Nocardioides panacisoli]|uniref:Glycosyltransferase family 4 protein n=1 Tax=Nocardioides panacisoli TaxID=627624 RepID=A0ABP7I407_9ACTN
MSTDVHFVVPSGIDDPARPSGGNVYDRRLAAELARLGRLVLLHRVGAADRGALARLLAGLPRGATVLVDGLIGSVAGDELAAESERLRLAVLLHMPLGQAEPDTAAGEARALGAARVTIAASRWTRQWVLAHYGLERSRVAVALPGTDPGPLAVGGPSGRELLCVAAVTPGKGHATLVAALAAIADLDWRCTCVGALDLDPEHVRRLRVALEEAGLGDRVDLLGPLVGDRLERVRTQADLVVSASRHEAFGMALAEGVARGLPVVATDVGGTPEALGCGSATASPGLLVPPDDPAALAAGLRRWLTDSNLRGRLRSAAARRRDTLATWQDTAQQVAAALDAASR